MRNSRLFSIILLSRLISGVAIFACSSSVFGETFIVKDGQPQAEIVISDKPTRMAKLAAEELKSYVEKISGAKLAISNVPSETVPVKIYVGKSTYTDQMKIAGEDLKYGAFRMVSGKNYLVLLGNDKDFIRQEPFHSGGRLEESGETMAKWDKITGEKWGFPYGNLSKEYNDVLKIWEKDQRGSFNAVCEFLRMQGVRWYMPGEFGEILPKNKNIVLPEIDKTVKPDFALRAPYQGGRMFGQTTRDEVMWQLHLGFNNGPEPLGEMALSLSHGGRLIYERDVFKDAHPDFMALFGGKRDKHAPCLSSKGLFDQNVKFVRTMYDVYNEPLVSVMPEDGYVNLCQCELCKGKDTLDRGWTGQISDYVWDYVNRVATEVYKTHPDRKIGCMAYGAFLLPPEKIEKFSPNVVVGICQWRGEFQDPKTRQEFLQLREAWLKKLPESGQLIIYDYYLHGRPKMPWDGIPALFTGLIAQDLKSLKGKSMGEFLEVYRDTSRQEIGTLAVLHLNLYVTSRFWWDADLDLKAMLEEYYTLFYGPAREEMKTFIEYCEANWAGMRKSAEKIDKVNELLGKAQQKVPADSIYGKRIALIADYVKPLKELKEKVLEGHKNAPKAQGLTRDKKDLKMDGKLDESFWDGLPSYDLKELVTGKPVISPTSFKMAWANDSIYFGIKCMDADMKNLNIGTTRNEDTNIWNGDCVEILLETQTHSYYQLAINPSGAMMDLDRNRGTESLWASGAKVASYIGDGYWSVEVRIPVAGGKQEEIDSRNGVSGDKPEAGAPWYFNVCRQRVHDKVTEASAFSPTGENIFHMPMKFGELEMK